MTKLYLYDNCGNYTGEFEHVQYQPVPINSTMIPPPDGNYPVWNGSYWQLMDAPAVPPPPTSDQITAGVQVHIDQTAQSKGYEDGVSLATYVPSTVEMWRAEADAFIPWRDSVWEYTYTTLAKIESGEIPPPATVDEFISWLPPIVWPQL